MSFISANLLAVKSINAGSFFFPLLGTGAKNGLSVSINSLSVGIYKAWFGLDDVSSSARLATILLLFSLFPRY